MLPKVPPDLGAQSLPLPLSSRLLSLFAVVGPVVGLITGCILLWGSGFGLVHYSKDLRKDMPIRVANALFPLWVILSLLVPTVLGGLLTMSWWGALLGFLWGGLARICLCHHITWSVNSVCHFWGRRPFQVPDESRNNFLFGL